MRKPRTTTPTRKTLTDEALAALRRDYEADAEPLTAVAARFSISTDALRRIARDMAFAPRPKAKPFARKGVAPVAPEQARPEPAPAEPTPSDPAPAPPLKPLDLTRMAARVRRSVETHLGRIHDRLEQGADVESQARTLASLVKTLGDLDRLEHSRAPADAAADGPWDIADLRAEIARRIDRLGADGPA